MSVTATTDRRRSCLALSVPRRALLEVLFLQTVTDRDDCNGPQLLNIGTISDGGDTYSQMKVGSVFRWRMAEYGSGEEKVNVMQMHV